MFFHSYKEAHEKLNIPGSWQKGTQGNKETGITSIKLTHNPASLDRVSQDLSTVYYVGIGKKTSQGEPAEHQTKENQEPFFVSQQRQNLIPVLIKLKTGLVYFPGYYRVKKIQVKRSPGAFLYYQIVLQRNTL